MIIWEQVAVLSVVSGVNGSVGSVISFCMGSRAVILYSERIVVFWVSKLSLIQGLINVLWCQDQYVHTACYVECTYMYAVSMLST